MFHRTFFAFALSALYLCLNTPSLFAASVIGQTGKPDFNVFIPGDTVPLEFTVAGLAPGSDTRTLRVKVVDEHEKLIVQKDIFVASSDGSWTTTYMAPADKLGFYRVYASLSSGEALPATGSRKAGYLTYAIVPDPASRQAYSPEDARFGMQGGFNGALNPIPYLGINWVNGPGGWAGNEPNHAGQFAQARVDKKSVGDWGPSKTPGATAGYEWAFIIRDGKRGAWPVYPVFALYNPPTWAYIPGHKVGSTAPLKPEAYDAWEKYCKAFALSVVEDYPNVSEHFYQVTWEPNWFNGTDLQFYDIYRIAYDSIHAVDPRAIVAGPTKSGVGDYNMNMEAAAFQLGLGSKIDAYTIHPYTAMPAEANNYLDKIRLLIAFPTKRSGHSIPVYSTEQGDQTKEETWSEIDQARNLIRASLITLGEGVHFYMGFYLHDFPGKEGYGYFYNLRDDRRFGTDALSPKPIVPAFAAETSLIDGHETVGPIDTLGNTVLGYSFQRQGDVVLALWDYSGTPRSVTLDTGVKTVDVYDWMGNKRVVPTTNGSLIVVLTSEPLYIRGVSPAGWGKESARLLDLAASSISTMPGGHATIAGMLRGTAGKALVVKLMASSNASLGTASQMQRIALPAGTAKTFHVNLTVPARSSFGTYVVDVIARSGGTIVASRKVRIDVEPPIRIVGITPSLIQPGPNGTLTLKSVKVSLSSTQEQLISGMLSLTVAGVTSLSARAQFAVDTNSDPVVELPCIGLRVDPGRTYSATLTATTAGGYRFTEPLVFALASATRLATAPNIDGDLSKWSSVPMVPLADAAGKAVGTIRFAWGAWGLGIAAEVSATAAIASQELSNLQIATNLDPSKVERSTGDVYNDTLGLRRFQVLSLCEKRDGPQATHIFTFNGNLLHSGIIPKWEMPLKIVHIDGKTVYVTIIPWKHMGAQAPVQAGGVIGIAAAVNAPESTQTEFAKNAPVCAAATLFGGIIPQPDSNKLGCLLLSN